MLYNIIQPIVKLLLTDLIQGEALGHMLTGGVVCWHSAMHMCPPLGYVIHIAWKLHAVWHSHPKGYAPRIWYHISHAALTATLLL